MLPDRKNSLLTDQAVDLEPERNKRDQINRAKRATKDRKSTRLNSSHSQTSYAVFCLKKPQIHRDGCAVRITVRRRWQITRGTAPRAAPRGCGMTSLPPSLSIDYPALLRIMDRYIHGR